MFVNNEKCLKKKKSDKNKNVPSSRKISHAMKFIDVNNKVNKYFQQ